MSKADGIFVNMCKEILEHGYSTEGQVVRAKWADDGAPAHTRKIFGVCSRYDLQEEFPALTLRPTPMKNAIDETNRRREIQEAYNREHGITPQTIHKAVRDLISTSKEAAETEKKIGKAPEDMDRGELEELIDKVEKQMRAAAAELNFEMAAQLRDEMVELKKNLDDAKDTEHRVRRANRRREADAIAKNALAGVTAPKKYNRKKKYNRGGMA